MHLNENYNSALQKYGKEMTEEFLKLGLPPKFLLSACRFKSESNFNSQKIVGLFRKWMTYVLKYDAVDVNQESFDSFLERIEQGEILHIVPNILWHNFECCIGSIDSLKTARSIPVENVWCIKAKDKFRRYASLGHKMYIIFSPNKIKPFTYMIAQVHDGEVDYWDMKNYKYSDLYQNNEHKSLENMLPKEIINILYNEAANQTVHKKKQRLSESRMREIIQETIHKHLQRILTEGRNADKAKAQTIQVIRNYFNNASWLDNEFESPDANPNHLSVIDYIENKFKEWLFHANISDAVIRLEPIMMNVALNLGYEQDPSDVTKLNRLGMMVEYIKLNYKKEGFPIPLNKLTLENTTYDSLNEIFGKIVDNEIAKDKAEANSSDDNSHMNPNYEIIEVKDYQTAHEIGNYSCSESKLCYTQSEYTWKQYLGRDNRVYVVLRKNYKDIPEEHGENTPYDEYGLSMIFLFINPDGNIAYSNTRWNHRTLGNGPSNVDQSFKKSDISKLLGVNFDETFKPNVIDYSNYEQLGDFDKETGWAKVYNETYECFNFVNKDGEYLSDQWFDDCRDFCEGFAIVKLNGKCNFVNKDGEYLSDQWFDDYRDFCEGFARVNINGKWNYINTNGDLILDQWFDDIKPFYNGSALVNLKGKYNYINTKGEPILDQWFDSNLECDKAMERYELQHQNETRMRNKWLSTINEWNDRLYRIDKDNRRHLI